RHHCHRAAQSGRRARAAGRTGTRASSGSRELKGAPMKFSMLIRVALRALRRNRLRSTLTVLGIIIGVAAVIAMVSIGQGARDSVQSQIKSLGSNLVMVFNGSVSRGGAS